MSPQSHAARPSALGRPTPRARAAAAAPCASPPPPPLIASLPLDTRSPPPHTPPLLPTRLRLQPPPPPRAAAPAHLRRLAAAPHRRDRPFPAVPPRLGVHPGAMGFWLGTFMFLVLEAVGFAAVHFTGKRGNNM